MQEISTISILRKRIKMVGPHYLSRRNQTYQRKNRGDERTRPPNKHHHETKIVFSGAIHHFSNFIRKDGKLGKDRKTNEVLILIT